MRLLYLQVVLVKIVTSHEEDDESEEADDAEGNRRVSSFEQLYGEVMSTAQSD